MSDSDLSFWEHVYVLRRYVLVGALFFIAIAFAVFVFGETLLSRYLLEPVRGESLVFLSPLGPFLFKLKVSLLAAFVVSFPLWLALTLRFVGEALTASQRFFSFVFVGIAALLALGSIFLAYIYLVPVSLTALSQFVVPGTSLMLTAESYLNFFILCTLVSFVVLELPAVIIGLSAIGLVSPHSLARKRPALYIGLLIFMAVLTPTTDVVTLGLVLVPAVILVEVGIACAKVVYTRRTDEHYV